MLPGNRLFLVHSQSAAGYLWQSRGYVRDRAFLLVAILGKVDVMAWIDLTVRYTQNAKGKNSNYLCFISNIFLIQRSKFGEEPLDTVSDRLEGVLESLGEVLSDSSGGHGVLVLFQI